MLHRGLSDARLLGDLSSRFSLSRLILVSGPSYTVFALPALNIALFLVLDLLVYVSSDYYCSTKLVNSLVSCSTCFLSSLSFLLSNSLAENWIEPRSYEIRFFSIFFCFWIALLVEPIMLLLIFESENLTILFFLASLVRFRWSNSSSSKIGLNSFGSHITTLKKEI